MADPKLLFLIDAKNASQKAFGQVQKDLGGVGTAARASGGGIGSWATALGGSRLAMLGVAGAAGIGAIALKGAVTAAIDEERNIAKLTAALKANIPGWTGNTDAIDERIQAGIKLAFSDDDQRASLALLVAATKDVTKAQTLQATAMDLARLKGISLEDASVALIKVESGQYRILKSLGIQLPKNASATEALAAVQKVAGGQAEAYAETSAGAMESLGITVGDLSEDFGAMLLPVIKEVAVFARDDLVPAIRGAAEVIGALISAVGDAASAIEDFDLGPLEVLADVLNGIQQGAVDAGRGVREALIGPEGVGATVDEVALEVRSGADAIARNTKIGITDPLVGEVEKAQTAVKTIAKATPLEIAKSLREGSDPVSIAAALLRDSVKNALTPTKEIANLEGVLTGDELRKGLNSKIPETRAAALAYQAAVKERLFALRRDVPGIALGTGTDYATALAGAKQAVKVEAQALARATRVPLEGLNSRPWGYNLSAQYAGGISAGTSLVRNAAYSLATTAAKYLQFASPAELGPFSEGGGPEGWGGKMTTLYARGIDAGIPAINNVLGGLGSIPMTLPAGTVGNSAFGLAGGAGGGQAPFVIENHLYLDGRQIAAVVDEHLYYRRAAAPR